MILSLLNSEICMQYLQRGPARATSPQSQQCVCKFIYAVHPVLMRPCLPIWHACNCIINHKTGKAD